MDQSLVILIAACIAFVGSHIALSHPLRAPLVGRLGEKGFMAFYSAIALACLYWVVKSFKAAAPTLLGGSGTLG